MQQVSLRDWQTIEQLRFAAKEGLISREEFKILLCPQLFITEASEELPPGVTKLNEAGETEGEVKKDETIEVMGFHQESVQEQDKKA